MKNRKFLEGIVGKFEAAESEFNGGMEEMKKLKLIINPYSVLREINIGVRSGIE